MAAARGNALRDKQILSIRKILNLNEALELSEGDEVNANGLPVAPILKDGTPIWKVLVFDDLGRDVISPVLQVSDLRSLGVTMHMHISANRAKIPDVPAIYLVEPTPANLEAITRDLKNGLYSSVYVNFLSSIPRPLLEDFAAQTAVTETSEQIAQIYDQYLNFIVTEPDLFSLGMQKQHTYWALNSAKTNDEELDRVVDRIVSGLFSVVVTLGVIPVIRCPKGAAAEVIAQRLDRKLRDHVLNSKDNLFSSQSRTPGVAAGTPTSRPVLIILDRNVDLIPMLSHSWTYQSLCFDVFRSELNRITIETPVDSNNPAKGTTKKSYDLAANDFFWAKNACLPFPQVAEDIDAELTKYKEEAEAITKKTGVTDFEDLQNDTSASAQHLKAAITLLPELRERKATLDMHMNILAAILQEIQNRKLDNYFQLEEEVAKQTKAQILEMIRTDDKGQPTDKLRLFIIWFLSTEQDVSRPEWQQFEEALVDAGCDKTCLAYIRQVRATTKMTQLTTISNQQSTGQQSGSSDLFNRFSAISTRLTDRLKETGVPTNALSSNVASLLGGIKNFLPVDRDLTVTKITESIMDPSAASSSAIAKTEHYLYFDPRSANARGTMPQPVRAATQGGAPGGLPGGPGGAPGMGASFGQRRQGFSEALVFMVGGGSMDEYGNLQEWAARGATSGDKVKKRVLYGASELINAGQFITEELNRLGKEIS
ncbi:Vesicle trafficking between the ER and Golgi [Podospora bellae-mahoneyi]|uniref:Vesicle trafficking between the ER and Golgi n=1 Tax=Podospora bellae-mahoneyi TaxID=2093777 RepID=A0ABR0FV03_9PEZI|nr:Vesicle trafficking between the ER and Golgi [Podospora bellae-mahoneyi]